MKNIFGNKRVCCDRTGDIHCMSVNLDKSPGSTGTGGQCQTLSQQTHDTKYINAVCNGDLRAVKCDDGKWMISGSLKTEKGESVEYKCFATSKEFVINEMNWLFESHRGKWLIIKRCIASGALQGGENSA